MDRFHEEISATRKDLAVLRSEFNEIRALSTRLSFLAPNDFSVPDLTLDLRSALKDAAVRLVDLDGEIQLHWDDENEVRDAIATGEIALTPKEVYARRHGYDKVAARLNKQVKDIRMGARGEERERKELASGPALARIDGWLSPGDPRNLSLTKAPLASRCVALNPFTFLAELTKGMKSLTVAKMLSPGAKDPEPSQGRRRPSVSSDSRRPAPRQQVMDQFHDQILATQEKITTLTGLLFKIQTLTSQPNPPVSSKSSRKLHTALHHAVRYIVDINVEIQGHWDAERRFAIVRETDERVVFTSEEVYTRRSEYDAVSGRFVKWLRVIDLRTRSEREVRESGGVAKPRGLGKYFHGEAGSAEVKQYVADNPFSMVKHNVDHVLMRMPSYTGAHDSKVEARRSLRTFPQVGASV